MNNRNVISSTIYLFLLLIITISSCKKDSNPSNENSKSLVLGALLALDQEKGQLRENVLRLAVDEINNAGGLGDDYTLELVVRSSEGDDREVVAAAVVAEIINENDNLIGFISSFSSTSNGIVENVSITDHYPCISGSATAASLSGISSYFHRLCPPDGFEANILADRANLYGINKVAIAVEDGDAGSEDLAATFQTAFGSGVSTVVNFSVDDSDYSAKISQLLSGDPDGLFVSMLNPDAYTKFFQMLGSVNTTFIMSDGMFSHNFLQADINQIVGEINDHSKNFGAFPSADTTSAAYTYFQSALLDEYNQEVASYNAQFYDIVYIYAIAIEKALSELPLTDKKVFREKVNQNIRLVSKQTEQESEVYPSDGWASIKTACHAGSVDYSGASGNCDIDSDGNAVTPYSIFKVIDAGNNLDFEIIETIY